MKKIKNQNAITLIALVITIIVLLILAGVSIATLAGENGILSQSNRAKEATRAGEIKEFISLIATENATAEYIDGTKISKRDAIEKLKKQGKLTDEEITELQTKDKITIGGIEIDFGVLAKEPRKLNVEYTTTEGTELWNSIVTMNISIELPLEEKRAKAIRNTGSSNYEEFKQYVETMMGGSYNQIVDQKGGEEAVFEEVFKYMPLPVEQMRELIAYIFDYSNFEEFQNGVVEILGGGTYENFLQTAMSNYEVINECHLYTMLAEVMLPTLSFKNVDKLENLGLDVFSVKTPYNCTIYTLGNVKCGFIKNGQHKFEIKCGEIEKTETVEINNIRNYDTQGPYDVKIEIKGTYMSQQPELALYTIDNSGEWKSLESDIVSVNNSITYKLEQWPGNWISYVIKDEQYYKYFADEKEWYMWCDNREALGIFMFLGEDARDGIRKAFLGCILENGISVVEEHLSKEIYTGEWIDYMDEYYIKEIWGEIIDKDKMIEKYPKCNIGVKYAIGINTGENLDTINFTKDTNIFMISQHCFTTDMYVEVAIWDEEKKKWLRKRKKVKDVTYDDELLVWDFDKGEFTTAKPLWIMKPQVATSYNLLKFSDGSELKTISQHRIFNKEKGRFTYPMTDETPIGTTTYTAEGKEVQLVSKEKIVVEEVEYMNIITKYHINVFVNNILTSCRFSNLYPIEDMKYVKDDREIVGIEEYANIPEEYYYGLRLGEQPIEVNRENDVKHAANIEEHIKNVYIANAK